jgi:hypothetical protein
MGRAKKVQVSVNIKHYCAQTICRQGELDIFIALCGYSSSQRGEFNNQTDNSFRKVTCPECLGKYASRMNIEDNEIFQENQESK